MKSEITKREQRDNYSKSSFGGNLDIDTRKFLTWRKYSGMI